MRSSVCAVAKKESDIPKALLQYAPLIYVAWSDGALTADELVRIRMRMHGASDALLNEWLNPDAPPSPAKLNELLQAMRAAGKSRRNFSSLVDFGRFLARGRDDDGADDQSPELRALRDVEAALGVVGTEALRAILGPQNGDTAGSFAEAVQAEDIAAFVEGERYDIRRYVFQVLQRQVFDRNSIEDMHDYRERVLLWCRELARMGISAYGYPREYEGENNIPKSIAAFETIAYHDLSLLVKFGVQFGLFGGSVLQLGTHKHHEAYLSAIARLELPGCFAMTETGHGSNVRDIRTTASFDIGSGSFVIDTPDRSAWKDYIGNAALHARMATVFAQLEVNGQQYGVHAFLVPIRDKDGNVLPGVTIEDCGRKIGLNGVDNGRIAFSSVRIPRDNLLDRFGSVAADGTYSSPITSASRRFFTMLSTLVAGRISIAAASCSASKLGLHIANRYAARRVQFGPEGGAEIPLTDYRVVQRNLIPQIARTYALDFAIHDTVRMFAKGTDAAHEVELRAAALKAAASRHAVDSLQYARELCGGQGYMWDNRLGELKADTDVFTTFEGANDVLHQLVAKGLLTELREQFGEMRIWAAIRFMGARAGTAVAELNPVITRKTDQEHLRDPDFHAAALRYRENRLLRSVANRLRRLIGDGADSFDAVNECQDHLVKLAAAHGERLAHESFQARVDAMRDTHVQALMQTVCTLYALSVIENDKGWYLESNYIEPVKSKAIRDLVGDICVELRPHLPALTDGWAIPERYLPVIAR